MSIYQPETSGEIADSYREKQSAIAAMRENVASEQSPYPEYRAQQLLNIADAETRAEALKARITPEAFKRADRFHRRLGRYCIGVANALLQR